MISEGLDILAIDARNIVSGTRKVKKPSVSQQCLLAETIATKPSKEPYQPTVNVQSTFLKKTLNAIHEITENKNERENCFSNELIRRFR